MNRYNRTDAPDEEAPSYELQLIVVAVLILATMRLVGVIHWSWWLVAVPIWGPLLLIVVTTVFRLLLTNSRKP